MGTFAELLAFDGPPDWRWVSTHGEYLRGAWYLERDWRTLARVLYRVRHARAWEAWSGAARLGGCPTDRCLVDPDHPEVHRRAACDFVRSICPEGPTLAEVMAIAPGSAE